MEAEEQESDEDHSAQEEAADDCKSMESENSNGEIHGTRSESSDEDRHRDLHPLYGSVPQTQVEWVELNDSNSKVETKLQDLRIENPLVPSKRHSPQSMKRTNPNSQSSGADMDLVEIPPTLDRKLQKLSEDQTKPIDCITNKKSKVKKNVDELKKSGGKRIIKRSRKFAAPSLIRKVQSHEVTLFKTQRSIPSLIERPTQDSLLDMMQKPNTLIEFSTQSFEPEIGANRPSCHGLIIPTISQTLLQGKAPIPENKAPSPSSLPREESRQHSFTPRISESLSRAPSDSTKHSSLNLGPDYHLKTSASSANGCKRSSKKLQLFSEVHQKSVDLARIFHGTVKSEKSFSMCRG